jgi:acyl-CoA thioesterase I
MADWTKEQAEYLFYFLHPVKTLGMYMTVPEDIKSQLWDLSGTEVAELEKRGDEMLKAAVDGLLGEPVVAEKIENLPFKKGDTVVCFGDSITDYDLSWAELLRETADRTHGEGTFRFVNLAISGDTTADMVRRFGEVIVEEPNWIITMAGTNDAKYFYEVKSKTMVSAEESARNFKLLREIALEKTEAKLVWMTPPPVHEQMCRESWLLALAGNIWDNKNLLKVVETVKQLPDPVVDLFDKFGDPVRKDLFLEDGLHPSVKGEAVILRALLDVIA